RLLDFEDLLALSVRMLEQRPALLEAYRARYPHVLVDEYQDLNLAQERMVELIAASGDPFVVGDDDQSIYRFRGASRASLERFVGRFPSARTIALARNRRRSRRNVAAPSALSANRPGRLGATGRRHHAAAAREICGRGQEGRRARPVLRADGAVAVSRDGERRQIRRRYSGLLRVIT